MKDRLKGLLRADEFWPGKGRLRGSVSWLADAFILKGAVNLYQVRRQCEATHIFWGRERGVLTNFNAVFSHECGSIGKFDVVE